MVNLQLPISHIIITSKARSKVQMSSEASLEKKETNKSQAGQKIGSIHGPFMKGSVIQLGNGDIKNVEDLQTEDFVRSAYSSANFVLEYSRLTRLGIHKCIMLFHFFTILIPEHCPVSGEFVLSFSNEAEAPEASSGSAVSAEKDRPFFVSGQGWSSCSPASSLDRYQQRTQ